MKLRSEVSSVPDATKLKEIFLLVIEDEVTDKEYGKSDFFKRSPHAIKKFSVHDTSVARPYSTKMLDRLPAVFCFRIFQDISLKHIYRVP